MPQKNEQQTNVFIAYSRKDVDYLNQLKTYLQPLHRNNTIKIWYDGEISPGTSWEQEIKTHLHDADIILLLVSADSLASDYFYDKEMTEAMGRHRNGQTIVVPIILKDCAWELTDLYKLQALPKDGKPISNWDSESSAYANIVRGLYKSIDDVKEKKAGKNLSDKPETNRPSSKKEAALLQGLTKKNILGIVFSILVLILFYFVIKQLLPGDSDASSNSDAIYNELIEKGDSLLNEKNYDKAGEKYEEALTKKPNGEEASLGIKKIKAISDSLSNSQYKVFGWLPFWMENVMDKNDYSSFTDISYFSYIINPSTGNYSNTTVIDENLEATIKKGKSKNKGTNFLLTITSQNNQDNLRFLENKKRQQEFLIKNVLALIEEHDLNGVNIELQPTRIRDSDSFVSFVIDFSKELKAVNPDYTLSLNIPHTYEEYTYFADLASLEDHVDLFIIKGYEFNNAESKTEGPLSPLDASGNNLSLKTVVESLLEKNIEPAKILVGLPYYGIVWECTTDSTNNEDCIFEENVMYSNIIKRFRGSPKYDEESKSAYLIKKGEGNKYQKIWFEDAKSLRIKYEWVKEKKLGGIAIWAIGYDGGDQELIDVLEESFK